MCNKIAGGWRQDLLFCVYRVNSQTIAETIHAGWEFIMKDFEELMRETYKIAGKRIPNMAYMDLPRVISPETKGEMMNRPPEELAEIIIAMIDQINSGSIESVDAILKRLLS